jgi:hypothetical protein
MEYSRTVLFFTWMAITLGSGGGAIMATTLPKFETQEIDAAINIGYAVIVEDIDNDGWPDLVIADQHQVAWYQNPRERGLGWKKHVILQGHTRPDNVCITALDITGDGLSELVLGAGWRPFDTLNSGQLVWLKRRGDAREPWAVYPLPCDEPTVHRVQAIDTDGDGRLEIVHVPLMGRGATREGNWCDGRPLRIIAMKIPQNQPELLDSWDTSVLSQQLHVAHNFCESPGGGFARPGNPLIVASYEGLSMVYPEGNADQWTTYLMHPADQSQPMGSRGASEVRRSTNSPAVFATIEPWHGNQVVVYTAGKPNPELAFSFNRHVIDRELRWGHAVQFADVTGDGRDELIIGVRDDPRPDQGDTFSERRGVRIYQCTDERGTQWQRHIIDSGGIAVEDLAVADLDKDGRIDIIAVGRQTKNTRIYWNLDQ